MTAWFCSSGQNYNCFTSDETRAIAGKLIDLDQCNELLLNRDLQIELMTNIIDKYESNISMCEQTVKLKNEQLRYQQDDVDKLHKQIRKLQHRNTLTLIGGSVIIIALGIWVN